MSNTMMVTSSGEYYYFDAVLGVSHEYTVNATSHPIQSGSEITDHAIIEPESVSLEFGMSDVMSDETEHSMNAFLNLKRIMQQRQPVTLITRLQTYDNMLITSLSTSDAVETMNSLKASMAFKHIEIVTATTVSIQNKTTSSKSGTTTKPADEVESVEYDENKSILYGILGDRTAQEFVGALIRGEL